jgi:Flp pilus assembly protein CpaB
LALGKKAPETSNIQVTPGRGTPWKTPWNKGTLGLKLRQQASGRRGDKGRGERRDRAGTEGHFRLVRGRIATIYTKGANRSRLAAGAIGKLDPWRDRK